MAKQVGGAPQQPDAGARDVLLGLTHHRLQIRAGLREGSTFRSDIAIVEAEERDAELVDELEGRLELRARGDHRLQAGIQPWSVEGAHSEHV